MTDSDPLDTFEIFGQTISQCQTCGQAMVGTKPTCEDCAGKVPAEALQELVSEWEDFAEPASWDGYSDGVRDATVNCANELQDVIDDYSNE